MPELAQPKGQPHAQEMGGVERTLRALSSESAQRVVAGAELLVPVPGVTSAISVVNGVQHLTAAGFNLKDGKPVDAAINAAEALVDGGQVLTGLFPGMETVVDGAATALEVAEPLILAYRAGNKGQAPALSPMALAA